MGRRSKEDTKSAITLLILAYLIPAVILAVYVGSVAYGYLLGLPCLYYAVVGRKKTEESQDTYKSTYIECHRALHELSQAEIAYASLSVTKLGRYDERSYKGREANANVERLNQLIADQLVSLKELIAPYANAVFTHVALYLYFATVVILYYYGFDTKLIPVIAFLISITGGLFARSRATVRVKDNQLIPQTLPKITNSSSLILLAVWLAGASFTHIKMVSHDIQEMPFIASSDSKSGVAEPADQVISGQPSSPEVSNKTDKLITTEQAHLSVEPMDPIDGFLLAETLARKSLDTDEKLMVPKGSEVRISGKSSDKKWYRIEVKNINGAIFVPIENVVTFTGN